MVVTWIVDWLDLCVFLSMQMLQRAAFGINMLKSKILLLRGLRPIVCGQDFVLQLMLCYVLLCLYILQEKAWSFRGLYTPCYIDTVTD